MVHTCQIYKEKLTDNNPFSFHSLKDNYTTSTFKCSSIDPIRKFDNHLEGMVFLVETLKTEVMDGTPKQQRNNLKQLKRLLVKFASLLIPIGIGSGLGMIIMSPHTVAASSLMTLKPTTTTTPQITPSSIMDWGLQIALIVVSLGVALAISLFAIAGIYRMITRNRKETVEWNTDILKGLTQVLVSIPLIYALFQLAQFVFKNLPFLDGLMSN
ncbi:hypothetical protein NSQ62_08150 [Solibacillus sp. FSL H8-0523]|uniref:hypothetical protein n=1 Tax=Solibacillus sp. FSL H8-0523 TaxID=2954511 RepID=UPI00310117B2